MNYTERIKTLFIDIKNLKVSLVTINGVNSNSPTRKEEIFSISKSVEVYGLEEYINQLIFVYEPTKVEYESL